MKSLSQKLELKPFDFAEAENVSTQCQRDSAEFIKDLAAFELWALKSNWNFIYFQTSLTRKFLKFQVYDASAKLPSGILNGNLNQLGDFDMCLSAAPEKNNFRGQYCLARVMVSVPNSFQFLSYLRKFLMSLEPYRSKFEDVSWRKFSSFKVNRIFLCQPNHVIPKTSEIHWALCVPSSCTFQEVEAVLNDKLQNFFDDPAIVIEVQVKENMCQVKSNWASQISAGSIISM